MGTYGQIITDASQWLTDSLEALDGDVVLSSPFLTTEVCSCIAESIKVAAYESILVTTLDASAVAGGYLSVQGLRKLIEAGVAVRHVERLHAKCFILGTCAMLGSANLTGAGLGSSARSNRELGVSLRDDEREQARSEIMSWPARIVTMSDLDELVEKAKKLTAASKDSGETLSADSALQLAERLLIDARDPNRELWLKLEYGEPALDGWRDNSYFASPKKGKPGFRPGDLVFICAKNTRDCYAVVEVTSEPDYQPEDYLFDIEQYGWENDAAERWPWVNRTKPRLVPDELMELKRDELGVNGQALQNGHVRLKFDQFTAGVRALARLATEYQSPR